MTIKQRAALIAESFAIQLRTYGIGLDESVLRDCAANAAMALEADEPIELPWSPAQQVRP